MREVLVFFFVIIGRGSLVILFRIGLEEIGMLILVEVDFFIVFRLGLFTLIANRMEFSFIK